MGSGRDHKVGAGGLAVREGRGMAGVHPQYTRGVNAAGLFRNQLCPLW